MAAISREIEVQAAPQDVGATWNHFIRQALTSKNRLARDLIVFKDYVERGGRDAGQPTLEEDVLLEREADARGNKPRHVRLSAESDTTFWRSHFPT